MLKFNYTIKDEVGIHARPAGLLVKEAKNFKSQILIKKEAFEALKVFFEQNLQYITNLPRKPAGQYIYT